MGGRNRFPRTDAQKEELTLVVSHVRERTYIELWQSFRNENSHAAPARVQDQPSAAASRFANRVSRSLIDSRFDHDSCGVGFVASALGKSNHKILEDALTALARLEHRGAVAADGASSDGIGLMTAVPRALLLKATGVTLADDALLGVGMLFLPKDETRAEAYRC